MADIGVLNLQIQDNSGKAADGLNRLADALTRVKTAVSGGIKLSGVANQISKIAQAEAAAGNLDKLSESLGRVKEIVSGGIKLKSVSNQIEKLSHAGTVVDGMNRLADALERIKSAASGGMKLSSTTNQISKLGKTIEENFSEDVLKKIDMLTTSLQKLNGIGSVSIKINGAGSISGIKETAEETNETVSAINTGFENYESQTQDIADAVEEVASPLRDMKDRFAYAGDAASDLKDRMHASIPIFKQYKETVLGLESKQDVASFGKKTGEELVAMAKAAKEEARAAEEAIRKANETIGNSGTALGKDNGIEDIREELQGVVKDAEKASSVIVSFKETARSAGSPEKEKTAKYPSPTFEDYFFGRRWEKTGEHEIGSYYRKDHISEWLQGNGTKVEQANAINLMAQEFGMSTKQVKEKIAELKIAAESASPAVEKLGNAMETASNIGEGIEKTGDIVEPDKIEQAAESLENVKTAVEQGVEATQIDNEKMSEQASNTENLFEKIDELRDAAEQAAPAIEQLGNAMENAGNKKSGMEQVADYMKMSQLDLMTMKLNGLKDALAQDIEANKLDNVQLADRVSKIQNLSGKIDDLKNKTMGATSATDDISDSFSEMKEKINVDMFGKLLGQFARIAKYRILRSIISEIGKGLSEGIDNVYKYSQAIGGGFSKSIDAATASLTYLKNSIGAAVSPVIQSLVPVLQTVINMVVTVVNVLNQLFSLLSGSPTWTMATNDATDALKEQATAAGGAGSAVKDLLADWDELNIIQSQSGGGGGGRGTGANLDFGGFTEMPLPTWMTEWKPLIEAVIGGTLGAVILPKILDGLSKIWTLLGGSNITNGLNILKKMHDLKDVDLTDVAKDIGNIVSDLTGDGVGDIIDGLGNAIDGLTNIAGFDWRKILLDNLPQIIGLVTTLVTLMTSLVTKLTSGVNITVDKKEFDDLKKEVEEYEPTVTITIENLEETKQALDELTETESVKFIYIGIVRNYYDAFVEELNAWLSVENAKFIDIGIVRNDYDEIVSSMNAWLAIEGVKFINIAIILDKYTAFRSEVDAWLAIENVKFINVGIINGKYEDAKTDIAEWVAIESQKIISLVINRENYDNIRKEIDGWLNTLSLKEFGIKFDDIPFNNVRNEITDFTRNATKTIKIKIDEASYNDALTKFIMISGFTEMIPERKDIVISIDEASYLGAVDGLKSISDMMNVETKTIQITVTGLDALKSLADAITQWCSTIETKIVNVSVNGSASGAENIVQTIDNGISNTINGIAELFKSIFNNGGGFSGGVHGFASGGAVRSGDLVMANENGNFEMMGKMGNQPVVANNQQIVDGISRGVTSANGDVVSELRGLATMMQRMLNKELVAKAVPSSSWGRNNGLSAAAYEKVTG